MSEYVFITLKLTMIGIYKVSYIFIYNSYVMSSIKIL